MLHNVYCREDVVLLPHVFAEADCFNSPYYPLFVVCLPISVVCLSICLSVWEAAVHKFPGGNEKDRGGL